MPRHTDGKNTFRLCFVKISYVLYAGKANNIISRFMLVLRSRSFKITLPYCSLDKTRHDGYSHTAAGHDEYLDELALAFKILCHHQSRTIPGHTDADS